MQASQPRAVRSANAGTSLLLVSPDTAAAPSPVPHRLPAVALTDDTRPQPSPLQPEHQRQLQAFEAPHKLVVADCTRMAGEVATLD